MRWGQCCGIPRGSLDSDTDVAASNFPNEIQAAAESRSKTLTTLDGSPGHFSPRHARGPVVNQDLLKGIGVVPDVKEMLSVNFREPTVNGPL